MRMKDLIASGFALVLSLSTLTGMAYTEQFQQAARIEVGGFDALAHDLFDRTVLADGNMGQGASAAPQSVSKQ